MHHQTAPTPTIPTLQTSTGVICFHYGCNIGAASNCLCLDVLAWILVHSTNFSLIDIGDAKHEESYSQNVPTKASGLSWTQRALGSQGSFGMTLTCGGRRGELYTSA